MEKRKKEIVMHALIFYSFLCCLIIISQKCEVTPNFLFGFQYLLLRSAFPHNHKPRKNTSILVGTALKTPIVRGILCHSCIHHQNNEMQTYTKMTQAIFFFSVAKQTVKRQKAELEALTAKLGDMETLVSSKVNIVFLLQF